MSDKQTLCARLRAVGDFMKSQTGVGIAIFEEAAIEIEHLRSQAMMAKPLAVFSEDDLRKELRQREVNSRVLANRPGGTDE